jgi:hypothetical protein
MAWGFWLLVAWNIALPVMIFIGRNWLKANIERSVQHRFDAKLESLRAELRKSEEELKSQLRLKEGQITALRDGVLSGRAQRQVLLDKRRLEAVDRLWAAFMALAPFAGVSKFMSVLDFDIVAQDAPLNSDMRTLFHTIAGDHDEKMKQLSENAAKSEQLFVSPLARAYFYAYQSVVLSAYMRAKVLEIGLENPAKLFKDEHVKNLLKEVLPHYSEYIDKFGAFGFHDLLEVLEKKLFSELQKTLRGEEEDQASLEQAAKIMELAHKVAADAQKGGQMEERVALPVE